MQSIESLGNQPIIGIHHALVIGGKADHDLNLSMEACRRKQQPPGKTKGRQD